MLPAVPDGFGEFRRDVMSAESAEKQGAVASLSEKEVN